MTRIHEWKLFEQQAREIFAKNPDACRFSLKQSTRTNDKDGVPRKRIIVILRVTDDKRTITYETNERFAVKRMSSLMRWFTVKMASTPVEAIRDETSLLQKLIE